jgi:multidrug efflux pump subunit AcrA (membrane-fusion protein)
LGSAVYGFIKLTALNTDQDLTDQDGSLQTAVARTGDISIIVNGAGEVVPASDIDLAFDQSGTIIEVLVKVGDQVKTGDVLVRLQVDKTEAQLASEIAAAELSVVQARSKLNDLHADAEINAAQALIELEEAQLNLGDVIDLELEKATAMQAVALAEESIANAEMLLYIYNSSPSDEEIYTLYASWLFKQENLDYLGLKMKPNNRDMRINSFN